MARKYLITIGKEKTIHFVGDFQQDYSLCGHDLAGDEDMGWTEGVYTTSKVNCQDCIRIVRYCKAIGEEEMKS